MKPYLHKRLYETLKVCGPFSSNSELQLSLIAELINGLIGCHNLIVFVVV